MASSVSQEVSYLLRFRVLSNSCLATYARRAQGFQLAMSSRYRIGAAVKLRWQESKTPLSEFLSSSSCPSVAETRGSTHIWQLFSCWATSLRSPLLNHNIIGQEGWDCSLMLLFVCSQARFPADLLKVIMRFSRSTCRLTPAQGLHLSSGMPVIFKVGSLLRMSQHDLCTHL